MLNNFQTEAHREGLIVRRRQQHQLMSAAAAVLGSRLECPKAASPDVETEADLRNRADEALTDAGRLALRLIIRRQQAQNLLDSLREMSTDDTDVEQIIPTYEQHVRDGEVSATLNIDALRPKLRLFATYVAAADALADD